MNLTQMDTIIGLHGSEIDIYRKSEGAADEYGDPSETWTIQATEKAWIQSTRNIRFAREAQIRRGVAGIIDQFDYVGLFKSDSVVAKGNYVQVGSVKYSVETVEAASMLGAVSHIEAYLKLMVEG